MAQYKEPSQLNVVSVFMLVFFLSLLYGAWKYIPAYWQKQEVEEMVSGVLMSAHRATDDAMKSTILTRMIREFEFNELKLTDIEMNRDKQDDWIEARLQYPVAVEHLGGKKHNFIMHVHVRRRIIHL